MPEGPHIVNVTRSAEPYAYVGRKHGDFEASAYGNPFCTGMMVSAAIYLLRKVGVEKTLADFGGMRTLDLDTSIKCFEWWFVAQPELVAKARRELRGQNLGCWCFPKKCHASVILRIVNS
jgi:hypothetical protein